MTNARVAAPILVEEPSAPHRANILSGAFNIVGIGYYRGPDGRLWAVQDFGGI